MEQLNSLSPLDGRYSEVTQSLRKYFSESALIKYRTNLEMLYLMHLLDFLEIPNSEFDFFEVSDEDVLKIKEIEKKVRHDVKAVELFLRDKINNQYVLEFIHFGLTSQDVNSSSYVLSMKESNQEIIIPTIDKMINLIHQKSENWFQIPMLSRTHGQPASPTTLGKELMVFSERLRKQLHQLKEFKYTTKFGGAVGNFNSHYIAYPEKDWIKFGNNFTESIGLERNHYTTQIDNYDNYSEMFDILKRLATVMIDFCRDIWLYVSQDYFTQLNLSGEVGSSAMPHKINPINFENAEGNLMMAVSLLEFMSRKLPVSRLQRDLTDSTVLRNIGTCYGYLLIGVESIMSGLKRIDVNRKKIREDLDKNKIVLAEAVQSILRKEGVENSYLLIKEMTRGGKNLDVEEMVVLLEEKGIQISEAGKSQIYNLDVHSYVGRF
tara:strand:- start:627 stop:1931 length:1305 start_codon:yes stop_codon:yes gene_type:complete